MRIPFVWDDGYEMGLSSPCWSVDGLHAHSTSDVGEPGHVIRNDKDSGESWFYCHRSGFAQSSVSHGDSGAPFAPGSTWRSIRMRVGLDMEVELFRLLQTKEGSQQR